MKRIFKNEAEFLKSLRKRHDLSQREMIAKLPAFENGVMKHQQLLSNTERGVAGLKVENWRQLHAVFGFSWEDLALAIAKDKFQTVIGVNKVDRNESKLQNDSISLTMRLLNKE